MEFFLITYVKKENVNSNQLHITQLAVEYLLFTCDLYIIYMVVFVAIENNVKIEFKVEHIKFSMSNSLIFYVILIA